MKKFVSTLGAMALVGGLMLASSSNALAGSAKDEITATEHKMISCTSADELMKYYADSPDVTVFDFVPPLKYQGTKAVHDDFNEFFTNAKDAKGEFLELVVVADPKIGAAHSLQHFTWTDKDGKPGEVTIRVTDVFQKTKGQWKVIHSHVSVPVDPKTGQGQMNLKP
ncbi:MAG TPA: nuclear transport factor 2 family protein [Candidatus Binataceae bacterium]|nr:nuclear transport factor 2 family protein [Candidatus Binataceae bacterium]